MNPVEQLPEGWMTAGVAIRHRDNSETSRYEIIHIETGTRYFHEPMDTVAYKCLSLFLIGLPLYFSIYIGHQTVRAATVTIAHLSPTAFLKQVWAAVRVPFYFICLEFAALYGALSPLAGRALFARVESRFHDGKGLHESVQYQKKIDILETCKSSLVDLDYPLAFFAAYCMQPFGKTTDPHVISVRQIPPAA